MKIRVHPKIESQHERQIADIDLARFGISDYSEVYLENARENRGNYTILTLDEEVIGYGLVVPTTDFAREAIKRGEMDEIELLKKQVMPINQAQAFYLASVATKPKTNPILSSRLVGYVGGPLIRSDKTIFAVAVSRQGEQMANEIGMSGLNYNGPFTGINGFSPAYFEKAPYKFSEEEDAIN